MRLYQIDPVLDCTMVEHGFFCRATFLQRPSFGWVEISLDGGRINSKRRSSEIIFILLQLSLCQLTQLTCVSSCDS